MKIWEIRLQNGIFVYKAGISFTKWDFHLQRETLGLQTGLSLYISPKLFISIDNMNINIYNYDINNLGKIREILWRKARV